MKKSVKVAVGVVIAVAALSSAGAWYTGTQLEGVLHTAIDEANRQIKSSLNGFDGSVTLELVSLDRHVFSSTAHYRVNIKSAKLGKGNENVELLFVDNVEHGPLPWSRVKSLNLMPVMAASNYEIEKNSVTEKWFALTNGVAPLKGHTNIGYDHSTEGTLELLPLDIDSPNGTLKFSGLNLWLQSTANAEKVKVTGSLDDIKANVPSEQGPVSFNIHNLSFNTGGTKGASGFYLGHSDFKMAQSGIQIGDKPPVGFKNFVNTSLMQEEGGNLAAQVTYDIDMISYGGKDFGAAQMLWKFGNFDVASTQALYTLYQQKIQPQQQAAALAGVPVKLQLSDADQTQMNAELAKLLAAKPHIELEKVSLKTANGESHFSLAMDLKNPGPLDQPVPDLVNKMLTELDAKLLVSKPMIKDLATQAAALNGQTDPKVIEQQARDASEIVDGVAVMSQLAKVDGDNVVSHLHYADGMADFNGQKMTGIQFVSLIASKFSAMSGAGQ
ncbi:YdgA family protein [Pseudomonas sp. CCI3.2]|uniref:YdgA family protein n=1 Tax=unclassified Pseudomonas TaxID=196821 RepID=UPI002AC93D16|nr:MULTISPECIES: YdgA family protein [unclassified Pseudomonas]MEB0077743.1 YdgA family protein [Pseudomonas sp. MH10out]MEB0102856.1 YdgA family protein [Pseudomonas sp. CCI3.2]MEB0130749.1 YdgA family protein [Pseudomonas sp. CCI2.4]MEB0160641.1 YdgA family protein [Pseudomonas sp. AH2 (2023)]MEB0170148.1 YdgA family protein [Pseudomonas sp. CCC4.4]